jgi:ABC-2 type transport system ATP-binding protein
MATLGPALRSRGAQLSEEHYGWTVTGLAQESVGDIAYELGVRVHELATRQATLEEAFLDATGLSQEFIGTPVEPGHGGQEPGRATP